MGNSPSFAIDVKREFVELNNVMKYRDMRQHIEKVSHVEKNRGRRSFLKDFDEIFVKLNNSYIEFSRNSDELWIILDRVSPRFCEKSVKIK